MSVQRYQTEDGTRWRVRWREPGRSKEGKPVARMRSRTFTSRQDALGFDADIKSRKFRGDVLPQNTRRTLGDAWTDWLRLVAPRKATSTVRGYEEMWAANVEGHLSHYQLRELTANPQVFDEFGATMSERGVGPASQRKTMIVVSAVLTASATWGWIPRNPLRGRPSLFAPQQRKFPRPFSPLVIEQIRQAMLHREERRATALRDATIVSLLAYAGLRPQEVLALRWDDCSADVMQIDKAVSFGEEKGTKTGKPRPVPICRPLADDLAAWRRASGDPPGHALIFPGPGGRLWTRDDWNNWRGRSWHAAVGAVFGTKEEVREKLGKVPPYRCRGSFVSLHLRAGDGPLEVAQWAGHSPQVMFSHYAGVIEELAGKPRKPAEDQIEDARQATTTWTPDEVQEVVEAEVDPARPEPQKAYFLLYGPRRPRPQRK